MIINVLSNQDPKIRVQFGKVLKQGFDALDV